MGGGRRDWRALWRRCYEGSQFLRTIKAKSVFPPHQDPEVYLYEEQQRKNAHHLGFILNEDIMKERRLGLGVEELSIQCKHPPWDQSYRLSAESVKNVRKPCPLCLKIGYGQALW